MMKVKNLILFVLLFAAVGFAQKQTENTLRSYNNPNEMVTLSANLPFNTAIDLLSKMSEQATGRRIVSTTAVNAPIGVEINNIPFEKALTIIVQYAGLMYETKEDVIVIRKKTDTEEKKVNAATYASIDEREVKISAVFFEMDVQEAKNKGIDWKFLLEGKDLSFGGKFGREKTEQEESGSAQSPPEFEVSGASKFNVGGFFGEATAAFKFFENENLGEILASPNLIVRDKSKGRIQVGSDFSIKQRDFSGNIIEEFFSTGSIIEVTPYVHREDNLDYILMDITVERSSFIPDQLTTEVRKSQAATQITMLNGEETIIGGFFLNEDIKVRNGIPVLKDLPWWVLGLRYIFGSEEIRTNKKELVILIKTELVPTLKQRAAATDKSSTPIKDEVIKYRNQSDRYQFNQSKK